MKLKNHLGSIVFWSVISAAFIGPGTVTTAASSGSEFGISLVWVLAISTIACIVLQVNVTRLTIKSNKTIGELLIANMKRYQFIPVILGISIVFGCVAYQAGNLLGAALGVSLIFSIDQRLILLSIVLMAGIMLWLGSMGTVVKTLGMIVALMGIVFIIMALSIDYGFLDLVKSAAIPKVPLGSEILVIGLVGTTIVPYNLFLGSGLSKGRNLSTSTIGLILAISLGGVISIAILLVGTLIDQPFSFEKLSEVLILKLGVWAKILLGIGLFSAGFTSSMTAPIAAVFTMQSVFPNSEKLKHRNSKIYRSVWIVVMGSGLIFAFLNIQPIPAIILAQAINGIILPFIAVFILFLVAAEFRDRPGKVDFNLILLAMVVSLIVSIGIFNSFKLIFDPGVWLILLSILIGVLTTGLFLVLAFRMS